MKGSMTGAKAIKHKTNTAQTFNEWTCIILLNNIRFEEDEITLFVDTLILGTDETISERCFICTGLNNRFINMKAKWERWNIAGTRYFPNVFSRALAVMTYLYSKIQFLLSNATLDEANINDMQKCKK